VGSSPTGGTAESQVGDLCPGRRHGGRVDVSTQPQLATVHKTAWDTPVAVVLVPAIWIDSPTLATLVAALVDDASSAPRSLSTRLFQSAACGPLDPTAWPCSLTLRASPGPRSRILPSSRKGVDRPGCSGTRADNLTLVVSVIRSG
jgi:hypothetical protein